jgi:hypothetical protein
MQADITKKWEIVSSNIDAVYFRYLDQNQEKANNPADIAYVEIGCLKVPSSAQFLCPGFGPRSHPTTQYFGQLIGFSA